MSAVFMRNSVAYDAVNGNNGKRITQVIRAVVKFWGRERDTYGVGVSVGTERGLCRLSSNSTGRSRA